jgi:tricorn protease interacting factor F2/3
MALTQFQESDARRALPCIDHPAHKATFDLTMTIDEHLTAISNCPVVKETGLGIRKKQVVFGQTPRMSTYLLFFSVGEFEFVQDPGKVTVRVAFMPGQEPHTAFGLSFGRKSLEYCENYYDIPFPLPKVDLIAISDFAFGAMENWGAITFRENLLLHYEGITSKSAEENITSVIAHEMAHQWFGNLVTPADWKYLWLNESFATFFGYGVVNHYYPEWDMWDRFMEGQTKTAMERDAMHETFPIELPGGDHVVINASTAPIIYNKGGSILRQIKGYIGDTAFRDGLRVYLKKFAYDCASSHHLWETLGEVSGKPVTRMMKSWIEQPGYPVIEAENQGGVLILNQRRFTYLPHEWDQKWSVPVTVDYFLQNGQIRRQSLLLEDTRTEICLEGDVASYKINTDQTGFFRVKYGSQDNLKTLGEKVAQKNLTSQDRWGLQNDLYAFVKSGDLRIEEYLDFLGYYHDEDASLPLYSINGNLHHAHLVFEDERREKVRTFGKNFTEGVLAKIGFEPVENERSSRSMLRDQILAQAVSYGVEGAEKFAVEKFHSLMSGMPVHPDIAKSVMVAGALKGDKKTFEWFREKFTTSESEHERMNVLTGMGFFQDTSFMESIREFVLNQVPDRNRHVTIVAMGANPAVMNSLWDWFIRDLKTFETFHPILFERTITSIIPTGGLGKETDVRAFFDDYLRKNPSIADAVKMALELMDINGRMRGQVNLNS